MKIRDLRLICVVICFIFLFFPSASASYGTFQFSDERFQGDFSTENLDRIIEEYELYDGWYWTTRPRIDQTFHGAENAPGWTDTAVNVRGGTAYTRGLYGCRWLSNRINPDVPGSTVGGYGECFGFAQFIGYLLSGDYNPYKYWTSYNSLNASGGLRVGDVLRTEFEKNGKKYNHSAVVYSVTEDEILFIQVSGSAYDLIHVGTGFMYSYYHAPTTMEGLKRIPKLAIYRSPLNCDDKDD